MAGTIKEQAKEKMEKAIAAMRKELASFRTGRATPALLDRVMVEYYGTHMPVNQMANI